MISGITGGPGIQVAGGITPLPWVNPNSNNPAQGSVRVWGSDIQTFDGSNWVKICTSGTTIEFIPKYLSAIEWAMRKQREEEDILAIAEKNATVKIALNNFNKAREQLATTLILSKEHDQTTS